MTRHDGMVREYDEDHGVRTVRIWARSPRRLVAFLMCTQQDEGAIGAEHAVKVIRDSAGEHQGEVVRFPRLAPAMDIDPAWAREGEVTP